MEQKFEWYSPISHFYLMSPIVCADNISKSYGKYSILENLSVEIDSGTVYGLVGLNGAGKTTLLRLLLGILSPDGGRIIVAGKNPWKHQQTLYQKTGVVLEHDGFWGNLTVRQNLSIYASAKGVSKKMTKAYFDEFWKDTDIYKSDKKVKHLSRGQKMQCALCRAFLGWPTVFFLDEPALALDVTAYEHFCSLVKAARDRGAVLVISSHQLDTINDLCDRVGVLRDKTLNELAADAQHNLRWTIITDDSPQWKAVVEQCGGKGIIYSNGWHFEIGEPEKSIPELIRKLVSAGCSIQEVYRGGGDFGSMIKNIYSCESQGGVV